MSTLDESRAGIASGINNAVARVAGLLAIAALGIVLVASLHARFDARVAVANVSPAPRAALVADRPMLGTARVPPSIVGNDRARVGRALDAAYTLGFRRVMLVSAALSWASALVALATIPPRRATRPYRANEM